VQVVLQRQGELAFKGNVVVDERAFAIAYADRRDCERQDNYFLIKDWRTWVAAYAARKGAPDISAAPRRQRDRRK